MAGSAQPARRSKTARGGAQDQYGAQYRVRPAHHRGGHHLFRVGNRTGSQPARPRSRWNWLEKRVPEHYLLHAHHWLILHGACARPASPNAGAVSSPSGAATPQDHGLMAVAPRPRLGLSEGKVHKPFGVPMTTRFDVLTIGNAIVDVIAPVPTTSLQTKR